MRMMVRMIMSVHNSEKQDSSASREPPWRVPLGRQTRHFIYTPPGRSEGCPRTAYFFLGAFGRGSFANSRFRRDPARPDRARPGPTRPDPTGHFGPRVSAWKTADLVPSSLGLPKPFGINENYFGHKTTSHCAVWADNPANKFPRGCPVYLCHSRGLVLRISGRKLAKQFFEAKSDLRPVLVRKFRR